MSLCPFGARALGSPGCAIECHGAERCAHMLNSKSLPEMQAEVLLHVATLGFEPDPARTFGDEIALIHSEVSEALEAYREVGFDSRTLPVEHAEGCDAPEYFYGRKFTHCVNCGAVGKPEDVASEFADIFIRLLHYCQVHGIDLEREYARKMNYNRTRAFRHGGKKL